MTLEEVKQDSEVKTLINTADKQLTAMGYTEHGLRHVGIVSSIAGKILKELGYSEREIELAKIAGYLHDIGNAINRVDHSHSGAILAYDILKRMGMPIEDAAEVMMAIGNHDEATGTAVSSVSAALILADKSDVHRSRVRNENVTRFEIHDRVNYAVEDSQLEIDAKNRIICLKLKIDTEICPVIKYFEIFLQRMLMCKRAAAYLNVWFHLEINGAILL
mgnify:CR=1 FL=1